MAYNFQIAENGIVPGPHTATYSYAAWPLGLEARAQDIQNVVASANGGGAVFVFCQGSDVSAKGQAVHISNNSAVKLAAANSASFFPVGVAAAALSATNVYGWVQVAGKCDYLLGTNSSNAAGIPLYIAAGTAGLVLSNAVAGNKVQGVTPVASFTSSQTYMTVQLARPQVIGVTAGI